MTAERSPAERSYERTLIAEVEKLGVADTLTDQQWTRMYRAFRDESPSDVASWSREYVGSHVPRTSAAAAPASSPAQPPQPQPMYASPRSDFGSLPVSSDRTAELAELASGRRRILAMTPEQVNALVAEVGPKRYTQMLREQMRGVRVNIRR